MRCLIGFFGITRSLRHTGPSIRQAFIEPLRAAGVRTQTAGHFNLPPTISNPRSREAGIVPDRTEAARLGLDVTWVEPQCDAAIAGELAAVKALPDTYGDGYRSLTNLCHQLRSLDRLWSLLRLFAPAPNDVVLLLRPDLLYLDALEPRRDLALLLDGRADLIVPGWQSWGGLNDRFAFCTARAARAYAARFRLLPEACREMRALHAEHFLRFVVACHGLRVGRTDLRAVRVRADGRVAPNDLAMTGSGAAIANGLAPLGGRIPPHPAFPGRAPALAHA